MAHLHGPVPVNDTFYTERSFETDLVRNIQAGRWVLLLGPRQHGKTSALIRLKKKLIDVSMLVASVDLQAVPPVGSYGELVAWFANRVASDLGVAPTIEPNNDLAEALAVAIPNGKAPIILLVDEASNIADDEWRNSFYGQLRALATASGEAGEDHVARRVRFVFSGTFRVERLVAEANSPFNTCELIDTTDLKVEDIIELASKANIAGGEAAAGEIFAQVGGQPYLVQRLLEVVEGQEAWEEPLTQAVARLKLGHTDHVRHLFGRVLGDDALVRVVRTVVQNGSMPFSPGDHDQSYLVVLGLLEVDGNQLRFRNSLYAHIASSSPNILAEPNMEGGAPPVFFAYPPASFAGIANTQLREIAYAAQAGAVGAYRGGGNRLALVGYGNALEAVILNYLLAKSPAEIATAHGACSPGPHHIATDPNTWTLVNLMRGARAVAAPPGGAAQPNVEIPESLRTWRNQVHPSVCMQNYKPDNELGPEVVAAAGLFGMVLRDLV